MTAAAELAPSTEGGAEAALEGKRILLSVEHLTMRFGGLVAVDDVSFEAADRDITAIIGPNGAGKTTLFNCLTGFYKPAVGRLVLTDRSGRSHLLEQMEGHDIAALAGLARTFQNIRLFPGMSVLENLLVAQHRRLMAASKWSLAGLFGLPSWRRAEQEAIDRAAFWLERVNLIDRADLAAGHLPYGAQRRLEIARAMCTDPHLLCLDEPAAGLNPRESADLNALLQFIRKEHRTSVLLIEHDMGVVMEISDHIVVLDYGVKISDGDADFVRTDPSVIAAYLGVEEEEIEDKPEVASLVVEALGEEAAVEAGIETPAVDVGEAVAAMAETGSHPGAKPAGLDAPRAGGADDLTRIKGIGPVNAGKLNGLGIWHFEQIAAWKDEEVAWVGSYLSFPGRIEREDWVGQARALAAKPGAPRKGKGNGKAGEGR